MSKRILLIIIVSILLVFYSSICFANKGLDNIDRVGNQILNMFRRIGFWLILIKCIQELVNCAMSGGGKNVGGIIAKYVTDAVRFSLVLGISPGNDIRYMTEKL